VLRFPVEVARAAQVSLDASQPGLTGHADRSHVATYSYLSVNYHESHEDGFDGFVAERN
jgi:hypothetical protein